MAFALNISVCLSRKYHSSKTHGVINVRENEQLSSDTWWVKLN